MKLSVGLDSSHLRSMIDRGRKFLSITETYRHALQDRWGREHKRFRDRTEIAKLFRLTKPAECLTSVDDNTWSDLELNRLFDLLDNTITAIGSQYLYRQLRNVNEEEAQLQQQYQTTQQFLTHPQLRENVQLILMAMRSSNGSLVTGMLFDKLPDGQFPKTLAWILASLSVSSFFIALLYPAFLWLPILPVLMNFVFSEHYSDGIGRHSLSFGHLKKLLLAAIRLSKINNTTNVKQIDYLRSVHNDTVALHKQFRIIGLDSTSNNVITAHLAYYLNLFCLFDFLIFIRCSKRLVKNKHTLINIYDAIACIDSAIAVASYLSSVKAHCNPVFIKSDNRSFEFKNVTHPLLDNAVANDFSSKDNSALITGSNMAGKSTFIKAIGINLVLAQTLWFCHAQAAQLSRVKIVSSIKNTDSLSGGKSTYFAEIERLLNLIKASDTAGDHLFLIDEILHGTNTVERVAGAAAMLNYLGQNNTVLVTSHDTELTEYLFDNFKSFHFRETADLENMFDYKIRDGHCTTRNAITLLEAIGFPAEIISAARRNATVFGT